MSAFATAVAASRVHLRAHHPTDVLGGAAIGSVLGLGLRPLVNAVTPGSPGRRRGRRSASSSTQNGRTGKSQGTRRRQGMTSDGVVLYVL